MYEDLNARYNNLSLEMEQRIDGQMEESYAGLDWANRVDRDYLWIQTSGANLSQFRYMKKEIIDMYADIAGFMYVYNPLIKRIVDVKSQFTFSRGVSITSKLPAVEEIQTDALNKQAFFSHQAMGEIDGELQRSGNVFIAIWKDKAQVRAWSSYEIRDIVLDAEDASRPIFYIRVWQDEAGKEHKRAYPSVFAQPGDMPSGKTGLKFPGGPYEIDREVVVYHMAAKKGIKQKFALSELVATCRWAKPHEKFLEDFAAIVSALRKYTSMFTTKGGSGQAAAIKAQMQGNTDYMGTVLQSNPAGSMVVAPEGNEYKVVDAGSNKIVGPGDSRYFLNMVCASCGVPETLLTGDPSTGNLATAKELTGPFLTLIEERQTMWTDALDIIFKTILESDEFEVSFPPIRSQDAKEYVETLLAVYTLGAAGSSAGTMDPEDFVTAAYEALDIKLEDETRDALVADMGADDDTETPPDTDQALNQLAQAAQGLAEAAKGKAQ
jgi:hypothetical protein